MKTISLSVASAAVFAATAVTTAFAAELPTYEKAGFPISAVQLQVLGAANVRQQDQAPASAISPHQLRVLNPRSNRTSLAGRVQ